MKKTARILSALLVLVLLLTGCQTTPENPTVPSTEPTPPQKLYNYDPDRPLPQKIRFPHRAVANIHKLELFI